MSNLISSENIAEIIEGCEYDLRALMQEVGLRPFDCSLLETNVTLLELVKYLNEQRLANLSKQPDLINEVD
jgi:hypothetical protein